MVAAGLTLALACILPGIPPKLVWECIRAFVPHLTERLKQIEEVFDLEGYSTLGDLCEANMHENGETLKNSTCNIQGQVHRHHQRAARQPMAARHQPPAQRRVMPALTSSCSCASSSSIRSAWPVTCVDSALCVYCATLEAAGAGRPTTFEQLVKQPRGGWASQQHSHASVADLRPRATRRQVRHRCPPLGS